MKKIYTVHLDLPTRQALQKRQTAGKWSVRQLKRGRILLEADTSQGQAVKSDGEIAFKVGCGRNTVQRTRQRFCKEGLEAALTEKPRPGKKRLLSPKAEQKLVAIACTTPPDGADRWTLALLVKAAISHKLAPSLSDQTVRQVLLRHDLKPWRKKMWCVPNLTAGYIARLLDVLEVYERPYDPHRPVICLDEKTFQLLRSKRKALALGIGKPKREDYEYKRHGTANAFVAVEPLAGQRHVRVTKQRRAVDFAAFLRFMVMVKYADAEKVIIVCDNLNIHCAKSLVVAFGEEEAEKILARIEWHYTPLHASWLNMAEIEINVLSAQCLCQRLGNREAAAKHVRAWQRRRNLARRGICWKFTRAKATAVFKLA